MNFNIVHRIKSKLQFLPTFILMLFMLVLFTNECNAKPRYQVGNLIEFGSYYQDDLSRKTPIKWRILDIKDGKALLISELLLDAQPYNKERKEITWENSSIRHWLNNEFINEAFNSQEKSRISLTLLDNWDNQEYGTNAGNDTKDKVFLLSLDEVYKYLPNANQRTIKVTAYAKKRGAWACEDYCRKNGFYGDGYWWLRSPGCSRGSAAYVGDYGGIDDCGSGVHDDSNAVRPALYINL
ncbi:MAG: DUF6273 domain-containing protein [Succinivibrionaceae bacterium]